MNEKFTIKEILAHALLAAPLAILLLMILFPPPPKPTIILMPYRDEDLEN
jgi:hypothetical protein